VWLRLNTKWLRTDLVPLSDVEIRASAFHEVMELFLARVNILAGNRSCREEEMGEELHAIIKTLQNVVFNPTVGRK
jgi:hypothetical protein